MPNLIIAGGASDPLALSAASDGALTFQTGPSGAKVNALAFASDGTPTFLKGRLMAQVQSFQTGAVANGTTIIPYDDTIPQITEGDQYMSLAITPINASSTLEVEVGFQFSHNSSSNNAVALFKVGTSDALAVGSVVSIACGHYKAILKWSLAAGSTSTQTFTVRAGGDTGTLNFNGTAGARQYGGTLNSYMNIKEYLP